MKRGFSLLEMMVVLVIVAALAAIALPYYNQHVAQERRFELLIVGVALRGHPSIKLMK